MPGEEEEEEENTSRVGLLNSEGAWCWREHCDGRGLFPEVFPYPQLS